VRRRVHSASLTHPHPRKKPVSATFPYRVQQYVLAHTVHWQHNGTPATGALKKKEGLPLLLVVDTIRMGPKIEWWGGSGRLCPRRPVAVPTLDT